MNAGVDLVKLISEVLQMLKWKILLIIYLIWNVYVLITMGRDKRRAKRHLWRISEGSLLWMGVVFGAVGRFLGMKLFHHKTAHAKFVFGVPLLILMNFIIIGAIYFVVPH